MSGLPRPAGRAALKRTKILLPFANVAWVLFSFPENKAAFLLRSPGPRGLDRPPPPGHLPLQDLWKARTDGGAAPTDSKRLRDAGRACDARRACRYRPRPLADRGAAAGAPHQSLGKRHLCRRGCGGRPALCAADPPPGLSFARSHRLRTRLGAGAARRRRGMRTRSGAGPGRRADPVARPSRAGGAPQARPLRLGDGGGAGDRRRPVAALRDARRARRADAPPRAALVPAAGLHPADLGFRDEPRRGRPALGPLARRPRPHPRSRGPVRAHRGPDRPAPRGLWHGAGAVRADPWRPAPRQPAGRRRGGEGHRLRRLRLRLVHV